MAYDYSGRAALVTGAASGLGRETALALARAGAKVLAVDVSADGLAATAERAEAAIETLVADLADPGACGQAVATAISLFGRLDLLCNVAGIAWMSHSADVTAEQWQRTMGVNLSAPFFLSQAAMPHLIETKGAIVNVASSAGINGQAYMAAYCASKAGLIGLTKAMAMEFMHAPVRINAIAPSGMNTPMTAPGAVALPKDFSPDLFKRFAGMREKSDPAGVADFILYVGSGEGRFFHGACLSIDQGETAG